MKPSRAVNLVVIGCLALGSVALLAGCRGKSPGARRTATVTPSLAGVVPTVTKTSRPTATAVLAGGSESDHSSGQAAPAAAIPTPAADPLRLAFPTPGTGRVSAWRPPLYPVPWAPTTYDHFYFARPIAADQINWPSAAYRYGGIFFEDAVHTGVDIPVDEGTPVLAAGPGKVVWAGYGIYRGGHDRTDPYGLAVTIRHDFGYQDESLYTLYGHLSEIEVVVGQHVETGELLALSGNTGKVTGPHLHFEVRLSKNDFFTTLNPELWLAPPQGWGVLAGRIMDGKGDLLHGQSIIVSQGLDNDWFANTYGQDSVRSDPHYQENMVIGDLPAGRYTIRTYFAGVSYRASITIWPGLVTYVEFSGLDGFQTNVSPPTPRPTPTPTP
jgi:murein DD-endopeptidase MepM/ murein hydrolase activator NlpD